MKKSKVAKEIQDVLNKRPFATVFPEIGRTKQAFKEQCDMNNIIHSLNRGNILGHTTTKTPKYGDVPPSFSEMQNAMANAKTEFEELPNEIQSRFESVEDYVDALLDPERANELEVETQGQEDEESPIQADSEAPDSPERGQQGENEAEKE